MSAAIQWSNAELARVYGVSYTGRTARACLAINPGTLTRNSTTSQWDAAEITAQAGDGYARHVWTLAAGAYNNATGLYEGAVQTAIFQASANGLGLTFNTLYLVTGTTTGGVTTWDTHVAGVYPFSPTQALSPGEPRSYLIPFLVDDITTVA